MAGSMARLLCAADLCFTFFIDNRAAGRFGKAGSLAGFGAQLRRVAGRAGILRQFARRAHRKAGAADLRQATWPAVARTDSLCPSVLISRSVSRGNASTASSNACSPRQAATFSNAAGYAGASG
jgi:hypothetical protein